jgi:hypothetical protein
MAPIRPTAGLLNEFWDRADTPNIDREAIIKFLEHVPQRAKESDLIDDVIRRMELYREIGVALEKNGYTVNNLIWSSVMVLPISCLEGLLQDPPKVAEILGFGMGIMLKTCSSLAR